MKYLKKVNVELVKHEIERARKSLGKVRMNGVKEQNKYYNKELKILFKYIFDFL